MTLTYVFITLLLTCIFFTQNSYFFRNQLLKDINGLFWDYLTLFFIFLLMFFLFCEGCGLKNVMAVSKAIIVLVLLEKSTSNAGVICLVKYSVCEYQPH
jgi:1-acyl-sn-glycerol-3-phosphate acyltransferase